MKILSIREFCVEIRLKMLNAQYIYVQTRTYAYSKGT